MFIIGVILKGKDNEHNRYLEILVVHSRLPQIHYTKHNGQKTVTRTQQYLQRTNNNNYRRRFIQKSLAIDRKRIVLYCSIVSSIQTLVYKRKQLF